MYQKSTQPALYGSCWNYSYIVVAEITFVYIYDRMWQLFQTEGREDQVAYPEKTATSSGWYYLVGDSLY